MNLQTSRATRIMHVPAGSTELITKCALAANGASWCAVVDLNRSRKDKASEIRIFASLWDTACRVLRYSQLIDWALELDNTSPFVPEKLHHVLAFSTDVSAVREARVPNVTTSDASKGDTDVIPGDTGIRTAVEDLLAKVRHSGVHLLEWDHQTWVR